MMWLFKFRKDVIKISPVSEAKKKANKKWESNNYKRINIAMLKEDAEKIDKYCKEKNISKNGLFKQAVFEKMEREP